MRYEAIVVSVAISLAGASPAAADRGWSEPEPVIIDGYSGHAMEPFISCSGFVLLFNNRNRQEDQTDLHWAERVTQTHFAYRGQIQGPSTQALEGVPSMDCDQTLYFISPRSYDQTLSTVYRAKFVNGVATGVEMVKGLAAARRGVVTFDAEISPSGAELYGADGTFDMLGGPHTADLFMATRKGDVFVRHADSAQIFANVNTPALEYAPAITKDGLNLFFTRLNGSWFWRYLTIEHVTRHSPSAPWGKPVPIKTITGYAEAPTVTQDGKTVYFHKELDGQFRIFLVRRN